MNSISNQTLIDRAQNIVAESGLKEGQKLLLDTLLEERAMFQRYCPALLAVIGERMRQKTKWGTNELVHSPMEWLSILMEEVGEFAKEANGLCFSKGSMSNLRREAVQVAAVALAIVESIDQ